MNVEDPLAQVLLDLSAILGPEFSLILGGGYGLFLKQKELERIGARTLLPFSALPDNRTTRDIDLILRAEVVVSVEGMRTVRRAFDALGFMPVPGNEFLQFRRAAFPAGEVKIDLMVGPLGERFDRTRVNVDERRVRPKGFKELHAHPLEEAVGVEEQLTPVVLSGTLSEGANHSGVVLIAQPFTYLLMKLFAFRDRSTDAGKDLARHHALDIYRIIGLITIDDDRTVRAMSAAYREHAHVLEARRIVAQHFGDERSLGILRMREHPLSAGRLAIGPFITELGAILPRPG